MKEYFKKWINNIPPNVLTSINKQCRKKTNEEHQRFLKCLKEGNCYLCSQSFKHFDLQNSCIHWLLGSHGPKEFNKKKHLYQINKKFSYHQIDAYFRWLANSEILFSNINDLEIEKDPTKIIEHTIKYKNLEWSFSCSKGDYCGHPQTQSGNFPHYHLQMRQDKRTIISFSQFHLPFQKGFVAQIPH